MLVPKGIKIQKQQKITLYQQMTRNNTEEQRVGCGGGGQAEVEKDTA